MTIRKGDMMSMISKKQSSSIKVINVSKRDEYISRQDHEMDLRAIEAVKAAVDKAKICNKPIAKYDRKTQKVYIEYASGEKKYVL